MPSLSLWAYLAIAATILAVGGAGGYKIAETIYDGKYQKEHAAFETYQADVAKKSAAANARVIQQQVATNAALLKAQNDAAVRAKENAALSASLQEIINHARKEDIRDLGPATRAYLKCMHDKRTCGP